MILLKIALGGIVVYLLIGVGMVATTGKGDFSITTAILLRPLIAVIDAFLEVVDDENRYDPPTRRKGR